MTGQPNKKGRDDERTENRRSGRPGGGRQPRHRASTDGSAPDPGREEGLRHSPRDVAFAILDGIEAGQEDIFPDPFAVDFGRQFGSSPKASERQIAAMTAAMLSGSAACASVLR